MTAAPAPDLPPLRTVIARHGLRARKRLAQHFLLDTNLLRRIAAAAGDLDGANVIEIGAGPGGLTRALLGTSARRVVAVERDPRCVAALHELAQAYPERLSVVEGDALDLDCTRLVEPPRAIVGNLPYNIATPLLLRWLDDIRAYAGLTLMFQREVADRLAADPGDDSYGRLSVLTAWLCRVQRVLDVPARLFVPPPRVNSAVVHITPRPRPQCRARRDCLERITAAAFGQRRKMLRSSLRQLDVAPPALLAAAGIEGTARAETLSIAQFCALARAYESLSAGR